MRERSPVTRGFAPGFQHHDRLGVGRRPQGAHEAPGMGDAFQIHHDAMGFGVGRQKIQHLGHVDGGIGAQRHHRGEADAIFLCPVQNRRGERPGLRHQGQWPWRTQYPGHTRIQLQVRALKAQTIRPQQMNTFSSGDLVQFSRVHRVDAAGDHQYSPAFNAPGQGQGGCDFGCWQGNDGQIGLGLGQIRQRTEGVDVQKLECAGKALCDQRLVQGLGMRGLGLRGVHLAGKDNNRLG